MRKRPGWGVEGRLRRRRRSTTTTMTWYSTAFLVFIKVRLDGRVCNSLLIFIDPPSTPTFYLSRSVSVNVNVPYSSSASLLLRLLIRLPMMFIPLLVQALNRAAQY